MISARRAAVLAQAPLARGVPSDSRMDDLREVTGCGVSCLLAHAVRSASLAVREPAITAGWECFSPELIRRGRKHSTAGAPVLAIGAGQELLVEEIAAQRRMSACRAPRNKLTRHSE